MKCPKCGDKEKLVIYPFNSGTMDWRPFSIAQPDLPAAIEDHKAELREMASNRRAPTEPGSGSYASAKMRS